MKQELAEKRSVELAQKKRFEESSVLPLKTAVWVRKPVKSALPCLPWRPLRLGERKLPFFC